MKRYLLPVLIALTLTDYSAAAKKINVLFIGNSYTYVNDLPTIISNMAIAGGDTMKFDSNTPGGTTLQQHCSDLTTLGLIAQAKWDYVVLQEQSQLPSFPDGQVMADVYPYAKKLDSLVHHYNSCTRTVFYMTWGRKNGDAGNCAGWPPVCTYQGMDSLLQLRYNKMADDNNGWLSPVAKVWRRLRNTSSTLELYNPDESHPSEAGSFAAACSFYALFFGKDPAANTYTFTLNAATATTIKAAAKIVAFDSLSWWQHHRPLPAPMFTSNVAVKTLTLTNQSTNATSYKWNFGDGNTSTTPSPVHTYTNNGVYNVCLTAITSCDTITSCKNVNVGQTGVSQIAIPGLSIYPNPAKDVIHLDGMNESLKYKIYDVAGREMRSGMVIVSVPTITLSDLSAGSYFLVLSDQSNRVQRKPLTIIN